MDGTGDNRLNIQRKRFVISNEDEIKGIVLSSAKMLPDATMCELNNLMMARRHTFNPAAVEQIINDLVSEGLLVETVPVSECVPCKKQKVYNLTEEGHARGN